MNKFENDCYIRVNKAKARKEYEMGNDLFLLPVNIRFVNQWIIPLEVNKYSWWTGTRTFDELVAEFEYYNCNSESGKYAAFYAVKDCKEEEA